MKTIESLIHTSKKVYVRMSCEEICRRFFEQAEREGFVFGDGSKPTAKHPSDLIAVLPDKTLCYVGAVGRVAAQAGADVRDAEELLFS